jgi:hypothetical protein
MEWDEAVVVRSMQQGMLYSESPDLEDWNHMADDESLNEQQLVKSKIVT